MTDPDRWEPESHSERFNASIVAIELRNILRTQRAWERRNNQGRYALGKESQ